MSACTPALPAAGLRAGHGTQPKPQKGFSEKEYALSVNKSVCSIGGDVSCFLLGCWKEKNTKEGVFSVQILSVGMQVLGAALGFVHHPGMENPSPSSSQPMVTAQAGVLLYSATKMLSALSLLYLSSSISKE